MSDKKYLIVWKSDSPNPGLVEGHIYDEEHLVTGQPNEEEVMGPYRQYVEAVPGTLLHHFFIETNFDTLAEFKETGDHPDLSTLIYNWETGDVEYDILPTRNWDDIRIVRNGMLKASDNMFNVDTPNPLKSEWVEYRQLLRDLVSREIAAGRTPETVYWHDYVPPWPPSARIGVPEDEKINCAWYKGEDTFPPHAIIGSPECVEAHEHGQAILADPENAKYLPVPEPVEPHHAPRRILNNIAITSTTGSFTCDQAPIVLKVGQAVKISGTFSKGGIADYVSGTVYYIIGSPTRTAFQLSSTRTGTPINTTVSDGPITGITLMTVTR